MRGQRGDAAPPVPAATVHNSQRPHSRRGIEPAMVKTEAAMYHMLALCQVLV